MRRGRQRSAGAAARWSSGRGRGGPQRARWGLRAQNRPASAGGAARCYRAARRRRRRRPPAQPRRPRGPAHCTPPGGTPRGLFAARSPGAPPPLLGGLGGETRLHALELGPPVGVLVRVQLQGQPAVCLPDLFGPCALRDLPPSAPGVSSPAARWCDRGGAGAALYATVETLYAPPPPFPPVLTGHASSLFPY